MKMKTHLSKAALLVLVLSSIIRGYESAAPTPTTTELTSLATTMLLQTLVLVTWMNGVHSSLTADEKTDLLEAHNVRRAAVDPPASNMLTMVWHDELASMAQEWADHCVFEHGNPTRDPMPFSRIGQNIWASGGLQSPIDTDALVKMWYDEDAYYHYDTNTCDSGEDCGHYTQVVWAKSYAVGCGVALCPDSQWKTIAVCNYGPGGNFNGEIPYATGTPCDDCLTHTSIPSVKCNTDGDMCELCMTASDPDCECTNTMTCQNGGSWVRDNCACDCPSGFKGEACEFPCACVPEADDPNTNCPLLTQYCETPQYQTWMRSTCATSCGYCYVHPDCDV